MKQINLALVLTVAAIFVFIKIATRTPAQGQTAGTPAPQLDTPENAAITEGAYNQAPSDMGSAFGPDENTDGTEVTSLQ